MNAKNSQHSHQLRPFPRQAGIGPYTVESRIELCSHFLTVSHTLKGQLRLIALEEDNRDPNRKMDLWEKTCFEFFFAPVKKKTYWEVNVAPCGDWNVFRFKDYRQGRAEEVRIQKIVQKTLRHDWLFEKQAAFDLRSLDLDHKTLEIGVSCVVKMRDGEIDYWALKHSGENPDFHNRGNFAVIIEPGL